MSFLPFAMFLAAVTAQADVVTQTIAFNRFGSMCAGPHPTLKPTTITDYYGTLPTGPPPIPFGPQQNVSLFTTTSSSLSSSVGSGSTLSASAPTPTSSGSIYHPLPNQSVTRCQDPVCPPLDDALCVDSAGATYAITCNSSLVGLIAFSPRLNKRTFASKFTDCLAICDEAPGCVATDWDQRNQNCLIYGQVTGNAPSNGSVAARRMQAYGGQPYGTF